MIVGGIGGGMLEAETWFWRRHREGVDDPELRTALWSILPFAHADLIARRHGTTGPKETVVLAAAPRAAERSGWPPS